MTSADSEHDYEAARDEVFNRLPIAVQTRLEAFVEGYGLEIAQQLQKVSFGACVSSAMGVEVRDGAEQEMHNKAVLAYAKNHNNEWRTNILKKIAPLNLDHDDRILLMARLLTSLNQVVNKHSGLPDALQESIKRGHWQAQIGDGKAEMLKRHFEQELNGERRKSGSSYIQ